MTEDEATTKWCPFARDSNTGGNRLRYGGDGPADPTYGREAGGEFPCIGSACMAWRTRTTRELDGWSAFVDKTTGYCGLAGAPQ